MKIFILIIVFSTNLLCKTSLGLDIIIENNYDKFKGQNVALLTNHSGRDSQGKSNISYFTNQKIFNFKKILVPEHGYYSSIPAGEHVENDKIDGIDVISLYGKERKPSFTTLKDINLVIIDIQDIGVRSYTYISTVFNVLDACAEYNIKVIILDRPNPIGGYIVDGNIVDKGKENFVSLIPISYLHGMTIGELGLYINGENLLTNNKKCNLEVIKMTNWERWMNWEDTGLKWFPTSPHIPTVEAIRGNTALGVIGELGFISIGIGTTLPFQYLGSPDFNKDKFANKLKTKFNDVIVEDSYINIDGLELIESRFFPYYGLYANKYCNGYLIKYSGKNDMKPFSAGIKILIVLKELYPKEFSNFDNNSKSVQMFKKVTGTDEIWNNLKSSNYNKIFDKIEKERYNFILIRNKYLLY
jgi:uncharacterized protein YbbC (DUF1343 family)